LSAETAEKEGGEGAAATAAGRAPALAAAVASLARAALTSRCWMTRAAAVSALATVALRSGEPFRLQCYTALREARSASTSSSHLTTGGGQSGFDACASALERHVATLDHVYRGGARFRALLARHGADETRWPAASLAEVAGRHDVLLELASSTCFLPAASYAPMGGDSRTFADAFAGDRASAARTAAELMAGEAASARRKAAAGRRRDGMASSVVAAFRRGKSTNAADVAEARHGIAPPATRPRESAAAATLGFGGGFDAFAATTTPSDANAERRSFGLVELAPSPAGSPAGSPVAGSPFASAVSSPSSSPAKGAPYDPFAVAAPRDAAGLDSPRDPFGSEPGPERARAANPFAAAAEEDATPARGRTVSDPFS
jgi:hypothetical protein